MALKEDLNARRSLAPVANAIELIACICSELNGPGLADYISSTKMNTEQFRDLAAAEVKTALTYKKVQ